MNQSIQAMPMRDSKVLDSMLNGGNRFAMMTMDAATAGGMAFLVGELEKRDPKLREPLTSVTWMRDIVAKTGGGWVETTSTYNVSYATSGGNDGGIIGGQSNDIPVMQADIGKDIYKVFTWAHILKVPFIDQSKLQNIGRSLDQILDTGIRLNYNKTLDLNVYTGFTGLGTTGLVNNASVTAAAVASNVTAVAASATVKGAVAVTDTLTVKANVELGSSANALNVLLSTAAGDTLAVTKTDATKTINIALANTTAAKNTAALIQVAIRALVTVGGLDVSAFTCTAAGNWDTATIATGSATAVAFTGGVSASTNPSSTNWKYKTPDEILADVNKLINDAWAASEYDLSAMPNHLLIPPAQFADIVSRKVSSAGNVSILTYLLDNNAAKAQGIDLTIVPCRWCIGAGAGATDRMVAYVNDEDKVNFDLTVPLSRVMTQPSVENMAYLTAYAAQIGQVKFMYIQCVRYGDGI